MIVLRSLLFIPGNRPNMLDKGLGLSPDAFIPDMEDSVPFDEKINARTVTASYLSRLTESGPLVIPRVNSLDSGLLEDDLGAVVGPHIFGVSVGKIESATDVDSVSTLITELEAAAGLATGRIKLIPWIETASAIVNAYQICTASPRIVGVAFGAEDYTNDMGIERRADDSEIAYPRNAVCVAARAADVLALDTPFFSFRDPDGLRRDAQNAAGVGFKGKFAIHPAQIDIINQTFSPSTAEVDQARRVVAAFDEAERDGRGATSLDGKLIDVPVVKRARNLLDLASRLPETKL